MQSYLFIDKNLEKVEYGEVFEKELKSYKSITNRNIEIGDIFRARVVKKVSAFNCFFVELFKGKFGFLDFKDVSYDIKLGDCILVYVYKINLNNKAPNVSMDISISSKFSVISSKNFGILKSRKLIDFKFDFTLLENLHSKYGIKLRTSCLGNDENMILQDVKENIEKFEKILSLKNDLPVPKLIYRKDDFLINFLLENINKKCIINDKSIFSYLKKNKFIKNELIFDDNYFLKYDYNVGRYVENLKNKQVNFKNINIVIENFEALTVIDVNSKKNLEKENKSKNALNVNTLAINEIIRQIIFRDISGVIIIDFINMDIEDKKLFEKIIRNINPFDDRKWSFYGFTKTGLYEISRQRR